MAACPTTQVEDDGDEENMWFIPAKMPIKTPLDIIAAGESEFTVPEPENLYMWHLPGDLELKVSASLCGDVPLNSVISESLFTFVPPLDKVCAKCLSMSPERWVR